MNLLQGYSHDVFVSYAHGPEARGHYSGERHNLLPEWTHRFVDDLIAQIDFNLRSHAEGDEKAARQILHGSGHRERGEFHDRELEGKDQKASALLSCRDVARLTCDRAGAWMKSIGSSPPPPKSSELRPFGRIFVARMLPTEHAGWPNGLKDELGGPPAVIVSFESRAGSSSRSLRLAVSGQDDEGILVGDRPACRRDDSKAPPTEGT